MMFAVFWLPNFRLQAARRWAPEASTGAWALIDPQEPKAGVLERNAAAARAQVEPGLSPAQARARCPALQFIPRAPAQEQSVQAALLEWAGTFSPQIEDTVPGGVTINLAFTRQADWPTLGLRAVAGLNMLELQAQVGIAPNPDLAWLAARQVTAGQPVLVVEKSSAFLAALPLAVLDPPAELQALWSDWGLHTLGQLTALPRGELLDRLGLEAVKLWERAQGKTARPLRVHVPVETLFEIHEFELPLETSAPLVFLLRRFLDQLAQRLQNVWRVAGALTLTLTLTSAETHARTFTIPEPTLDADVLLRLLQTHLDGLQLPHAIAQARLEITPTRARQKQHQLFNSPLRDPNGLGETLGRLAALVGAENVGVAETKGSHQPDSFRLVAPRFDELDEPGAEPVQDRALGLPLHRFRPPPPAQIQLRHHVPVRLISPLASGAIVEAQGPYRLSGTWWEPTPWAQEEWDIALADGALYRLSKHDQIWYVEGCYQEALE